MADTTEAGTAVQNFKTLFQSHPVVFPRLGEVVRGRVISADTREVRIDIAGLTTGVVRGRELFAESNEYNNLRVGDEVEATIVELENENGEMELSFRIAGFQRAWDGMKQLLKAGTIITAKVLGANRGGLMLQVEALPAFMPVSQLAPEHYPRVTGGDKNRILEKLRELVGQTLSVRVIDVDEVAEKLIVSERAVWEDSQQAVLSAYKPGDVVDGTVSALTGFGAFVRFGDGLEGLVHISEIAWQRIDHPKDILKVGAAVRVQIIQLDHAKIYLSIKRTVEDPWKRVRERYAVGQVVPGRVIKIEPFGLMVALDSEIHGLAHVSELSDTPLANLADKFTLGQELSFEVVSLEPAEHRLGLKLAGVKGKNSRRPPAPAPASHAEPPPPPAEPPDTAATIPPAAPAAEPIS